MTTPDTAERSLDRDDDLVFLADRPSPAIASAERRRMVWWVPNLVVASLAASALIVGAVAGPVEVVDPQSRAWSALVVLVHLPLIVIALFLVAGMVERVGYFWRGRAPHRPGRLSSTVPTVCVQLPMFNEHAVAERIIEAACALSWPCDRLEIQVLDDSTDPDTRALVDSVAARMQAAGVDCRVLRRVHREGYKAGALEVGRRATAADLLVIFDADFVPPSDFLMQAVPHFFDDSGAWIDDLALVQAQWGHLNHDESMLTRAQSLWVDDHHTVQMSWRSAQWGFVNFTGTAGVWRAAAVERAGGWRAASLVEDCELSFRHLFAGYRTRFVKEIVAPAELPATYTAYKAQQKRWTQGWVQLQRLHFLTLLRHDTTPLRRLHLLYHMLIPWQWALWALWLLVLPVAILNGLWFGELGLVVGLCVYVAPTFVWLLVSSVIATIETRHTYAVRRNPWLLVKRMARVIPYAVINTGMLPHQFSAFTEGLFGPLHSEFERTPKAATITSADSPTPIGRPTVATAATKRPVVRVHRPYVAAEVFFACYQFGWMVQFARVGLPASSAAAGFVAVCVVGLMWFYGDHVGRRLFVIAERQPFTR